MRICVIVSHYAHGMVFSWQMSEQLAAAHMRQLGFADAQVTRSGSDGGIDVFSTDCVAQVKYISSPVGSPEIQRLRGAAHGVQNALFYASSGYSGAALLVADQAGVALFAYDITNKVEPVNELARKLSQSSRAGQLEVISGIGVLQREAQSVAIAIQQMFVKLRDGEIKEWPNLPADLELLLPFVQEFDALLDRQVLLMNDLDLPAALANAEELLKKANVSGALLAQTPPPLGQLYIALAASARARLEAEHQAESAGAW